ncbi:methyltransferase [Leucobacter sp. CX328]|uniref:class I SAM-dependent methyltransferase n=1 Tax=unclassified Leucobacter TaxID=2621730 RepID=UPI00333F40C2
MNQHYFSETPAGEMRLRDIEVILAGEPRTVSTAGGVFSPEHLDRGTEILLDTLIDIEANGVGDAGPILDIGCGWGPIALDAALENPSTPVWAVDVNARSRELTAANAARLGLTNVHVAAPEDVPADLQFAQIRSNPPIRVGKEVLHEILSTWLPRLMPGGSAYLVVAKHLGADSLQKWIDASFDDLSIDRIARSKGFHIIEALRD